MIRTRKKTTAALALAVALFGGVETFVSRGAAEPADKPKADADAIQGTWKVVSAENDGTEAPADEIKDFTILITADKVIFAPKGEAREAAYKLDPTKTPKELELTPLDGPAKGKALKNLYQLDGDALKLCVQNGIGDPPTEFATKPGSGLRLLVLKRLAPVKNQPVDKPKEQKSAAAPVKAADFPSVSARVAFFEKRVNAADSRIRERVLIEAMSYPSPEKDYVQFLRRLTSDSDVWIRGEAIQQLHDLWAPLDLGDLPQTFTGYTREQLIDLEDDGLFPRLTADCRRGGAEGGWAAYVLGLLRRRQAVPDLVKLGDDSNEFARYAAGRALFDCGAKQEAKAVLQKLISHHFQPKVQAFEDPGYRYGEVDPYYVALAARAFMELGASEKREGLQRLVALLGELEPSKDVNDQNRLESARMQLAEVTGQFFLSHQEATNWLNKQEADKPKEDKEAIQGVWRVAALETEGVKRDDDQARQVKTQRWVFGADKLVIQTDAAGAGVQETECAYQLDPEQSPKTIDIVKGKVKKAVYSLNGDVLKICHSLSAPEIKQWDQLLGRRPKEFELGDLFAPERPAEVATREGSRTTLLILEREK